MAELDCPDRRTFLNTALLTGASLSGLGLVWNICRIRPGEFIETDLYLGTSSEEATIHLRIPAEEYRRLTSDQGFFYQYDYRRLTQPEDTLDYITDTILTAHPRNFSTQSPEPSSRVFNFIAANVQYQDTSRIQSPLETLFRGTGDYEDIIVLATALLER